VGVEVGFDHVEIKDGFEHGDVVFDRVDDFDLERTVGEGADLAEVELWMSREGQLFVGSEHNLGDCWAPTSGRSMLWYSLIVLVNS
jgi:hypothetical protein